MRSGIYCWVHWVIKVIRKHILRCDNMWLINILSIPLVLFIAFTYYRTLVSSYLLAIFVAWWWITEDIHDAAYTVFNSGFHCCCWGEFQLLLLWELKWHVIELIKCMLFLHFLNFLFSEYSLWVTQQQLGCFGNGLLALSGYSMILIKVFLDAILHTFIWSIFLQITLRNSLIPCIEI